MSFSPEQIERIQQVGRGTMGDAIGCRITEASKTKVVVELPFRDDLRQVMGMFNAGAILTLADTATTILANLNTQASLDEFDPARFPLAVQLSANFVRNSNTGKIVAEATPVHLGRRMQVVEAAIRDEKGRLLATVTNTLMVSSAG